VVLVKAALALRLAIFASFSSWSVILSGSVFAHAKRHLIHKKLNVCVPSNKDKPHRGSTIVFKDPLSVIAGKRLNRGPHFSLRVILAVDKARSGHSIVPVNGHIS